MHCPFCNHEHDRVLDSRERRDGSIIRRRRQCLSCKKRFTTYERIEDIPAMVIKKDNSREPFNRQNILSGVLKACNKRPISPNILEELVEGIEQEVYERPSREMSSKEIGERVMKRLYELDEIAYVRFASVYRQFKDVGQFMVELKDILNREKRKTSK